ncbi:MAG: insulinase family protein, partial [Verrucomicrobiota bacterium]|nr:insulinase family protein [Verrucomicrobiota bacterium]
SLDKRSIVALAWLTAPVTHQEELLAISLLNSLLLEHDASPLRKALLKSGLLLQVSSALDTQIAIAPWVILCKGCNPEDADKIRALIYKTCAEIAERPFPKEEIEASLHQFEFERSEINGDEGPFGLTLFFRAGLLAQQGVDPETALSIHHLFANLRRRCEDPQFLSGLLRRTLLDNRHCIQLTMKPDPTLEAREADEEKEALAALQEKLTSEEKERIIRDDEALATYLEKTENQDLSSLPKLELKDIPPHVADFPLTREKRGDLHLFHHSCFTNRILYADLLFDLPHIEREDLPLLSLLSRLLPELGAGGCTYEENLAKQHRFTGGIFSSLSLHIPHKDPTLVAPTFGLRGKCLGRNHEELFSLMADLFASPDFSDRNRLRELIDQHVTSLKHRLSQKGLSYASQLALSSFSLPSFLFEEWHGLSYFQAIVEGAKAMDHLIDRLVSLSKRLFSPSSFDLIVTSEDESWRKALSPLEEKLSCKKNFLPWRGDYALPSVASQARSIASPVASIALGTRTLSYRDPQAPFLFLAAELLQNCSLHTEVREKGGAYGAGASFSPSSGNFYLYSYRDPHLSKTWKAFQKALEKISQGKFRPSDLEEAKLSALQSLDAPVAPGDKALLAYGWERTGRTHQKRAQFRETLLAATSQEVAQTLSTELLQKEKIFITFLGESLYKKEKDRLPFPLPLHQV